MPALLDIVREELALAKEQSLSRSIKETERLGGGRVRRAARNTFLSVATTISASLMTRA